MAHVTMIHGIANKPRTEQLLAGWERALAGEAGLDLATEGITSSMVYWADVMYNEPGEASQMHESTGADVMTSVDDDALDWQAELTAAEAAFVATLGDRLRLDAESPAGDDFAPPADEQDGSYERIPIPWFIKRRLMRVLLRDVHHYLFNAVSTPRDEHYLVQDEIRQRFVRVLEEARETDPEGPHVLISHSMGTVIAYDCLKRVPDCPPVDALFTLGTPLGLDEIQDKMRPEWTRDDGFPDAVKGDWVNVVDRLDVVAALDPIIANDYRQGGNDAIDDVVVENNGLWRHDVTKYLAQPALRQRLTDQLGL